MRIDELDFQPHPALPLLLRARVMFPNGFCASVITGELFIEACPETPYEIMVISPVDDEEGATDIEGIWSLLTEDRANELLAQVEVHPDIRRGGDSSGK